MNFVFDATVKLGDVLTAVTFLSVGIAAYVNIRERLTTGQLIMTALGKEIEDIKDTLKLNANTLTLVATQKIEIEHIQKTIDEMKHGQGFILPRKS